MRYGKLKKKSRAVETSGHDWRVSVKKEGGHLLTLPTGITISALPTLPPEAPVPSSYWRLVARGAWPKRYWLPTTEPTSDALDGVALHAFATRGPRQTYPALPLTFWPLTANGSQYVGIDTARRNAIRYVDTEVDQWLTVAATVTELLTRLRFQPVPTAIAPTPQMLAHALLVADATTLGDWLDIARDQLPLTDQLIWLTNIVTTRGLAEQKSALASYRFMRTYQRRALTSSAVATLDAAFAASPLKTAWWQLLTATPLGDET